MKKPELKDDESSALNQPLQRNFEAEEANDEPPPKTLENENISSQTDFTSDLIQPDEMLFMPDDDSTHIRNVEQDSRLSDNVAKGKAERKTGLPPDLVQRDEPPPSPEYVKLKTTSSSTPVLSLIEQDDTIISEQQAKDAQDRHIHKTHPLLLTDIQQDTLIAAEIGRRPNSSQSQRMDAFEIDILAPSEQDNPMSDTTRNETNHHGHDEHIRPSGPSPDPVADVVQPVVASIVSEPEISNGDPKRRRIIILSVAVFLVLGIILGVFLGTQGQDGTAADATKPSLQSSIVPSPAPSTALSSLPTSAFESELIRLIQLRSPTTFFSNSTSPQYLALDWLLDDVFSLAASRDVQLQRFALATFWYSTGGPETWDNNPPWLTASDECEEWNAADLFTTIRCDASGAVTNFYIFGNDVTGTLPEELVLLTRLQDFSLLNNLLGGTLPTSIGSWTTLERLSISNNNLEGTLPTEVGELTLLTGLDLNNNRLVGEIPTQLANLSLLDRLNLIGNLLSGTIPASTCEQALSLAQVDCGEVVCDCCGC